jgi:hypothetical protein
MAVITKNRHLKLSMSWAGVYVLMAAAASWILSRPGEGTLAGIGVGVLYLEPINLPIIAGLVHRSWRVACWLFLWCSVLSGIALCSQFLFFVPWPAGAK